MLRQRTIFWFWIPLAFSFLMMVFEGPWIQGVMSRQPDATTQLAAFGLVLGLAVLIETPVISFLAVGNALARDRQSYEVLSRYVLIVNVLLTIFSAVMAFTPLLDFYFGVILDVPQNLIDATRQPMVILVMWTWFIGYRRFHQGILINNDRTSTITTGTFIRIIASAGTAFGLGIWGNVAGAEIGAWSLMVAVTVEMIYVYFISQPDVAELKQIPPKNDKPPLTFRKVLRFHMPLAVTAIMAWFILPLTQRGLAQADNAVDVIAAYAIIFSIMMIMNAGGSAWQEAVIALNKNLDAQKALRQFTVTLGTVTSIILLIFASTPLIDIYVGTVLGAPANLIPLISTGALFAIFLPMLTTWQSYLRALLMTSDTTSPIYQAMIVNFFATIGALWIGIAVGLPPIPVAVTALTIGASLDVGFLWWSLVRIGVQPFRPQLQPA